MSDLLIQLGSYLICTGWSNVPRAAVILQEESLETIFRVEKDTSDIHTWLYFPLDNRVLFPEDTSGAVNMDRMNPEWDKSQFQWKHRDAIQKLIARYGAAGVEVRWGLIFSKVQVEEEQWLAIK